ncbi:MAG: hypothetical protein IPO56_17095 [Flavobacteriales bacterium]|nr:hypothetical protein [Flavobacteriales bacterium]
MSGEINDGTDDHRSGIYVETDRSNDYAKTRMSKLVPLEYHVPFDGLDGHVLILRIITKPKERKDTKYGMGMFARAEAAQDATSDPAKCDHPPAL